MASVNPGAARVVSLSDGTSHLIGSLPVTVGRDPVSDIRVDEEQGKNGKIITFVVREKKLIRSVKYDGVNVEGRNPREVSKAIEAGEFDAQLKG